jgi:starch phosphorylase
MPAELRPLADLATDLWWSWHPDARELFRAIDPERWESCGDNPVKLLRDLPPVQLAGLARNADLRERMHFLHATWRSDRERPARRIGVAVPEHPIAFICAEFGVDAAVPIYSGGLGVLAGDMLKQASDSAIPMVAVGLFYRRGYFHQRLDRSGWQHEYWTVLDPEDLPLTEEVDAQGCPHRVDVTLRGRTVHARIWRLQVGRVPLYLLDTDMPENDATSRWITSTLYVGDRSLRLMQYAVLAIGGVRALRLLGIEPSVFHLNEGHASLAALELMREQRARGLSFTAALEAVRSRVVFTTHTPVAAGNERYDLGEVEAIFDNLAEQYGISELELRELTTSRPAEDRWFGVTELALRTARASNGVSRRHGETARGMWQHLWPGRDARDIPIGHITNGVHVPTWVSGPMRELLDRYLGPTWIGALDPAVLARIESIPDEELWAVRCRLREQIVSYVRRKTVADRLARGESLAYAELASSTFDPNVLTIGFARRVASYKRLHLLIRDPARAIGLLRGRRIQVVIAGRAHPLDDGAKQFVKAIFELKDVEQASARVAFLEDYDMAVARELVSGCDVWVNLPRVPLEASGTSGMKSALNGGLNLSVLDGWWCEAFDDGVTGWGIASSNEADDATQDARDSEALFGLLEQDVVQAFYGDRDAKGVPHAWVRRIKASMTRVASYFTSARMLDEYAARVWPAPPAR